MKKLLLLAGIISSILVACLRSNDVQPAIEPCQQNNTGTISVTNLSSNPYSISIDGANQGSVSAYGIQNYAVTTGTHTVTATQLSGYNSNPTIKTSQITITQCQSSRFMFP